MVDLVDEPEATPTVVLTPGLLADYFGAAWPAVQSFHDLLADQGVLRGLVGPREVPRLWERHLLNSAAVVPFLRDSRRIIDLGSGAGLPGVVIAAMMPGSEVVLLEPMERRVLWLTEVVEALELSNATVVRGRAEDQHGRLTADAVTARAVASMDKLYRWAAPMLSVGGALVALKGSRAQGEVEESAVVGADLGMSPAEVLSAGTLEGVEPTTVVRSVRVEPSSRSRRR